MRLESSTLEGWGRLRWVNRMLECKISDMDQLTGLGCNLGIEEKLVPGGEGGQGTETRW